MTDTRPEPELQGWGLLLKPPIKHGLACAFVTKEDGTEWRAEDENCTCGYDWRISCADYMTMYNAWRKRAEEAETTIAALRADLQRERDAAAALLEHANDCDEAAVQAEEQCERLREALRELAMRNETGPARGRHCVLCGGRWSQRGAECHAHGCLAALEEPPCPK